jgi:phage tail-like protein
VAINGMQDPISPFRFQVSFSEEPLGGSRTSALSSLDGGFAECTGLEATMEPVVIREGGRNYGAAQRVGPVSFATVVLRRGILRSQHLWQWFSMVTQGGASAHRLSLAIVMLDHAGTPAVTWVLRQAMPVKFKTADLNAKASEVGIEELHVVHEGLELVS